MTLADGTGRSGLDLWTQISDAAVQVDATLFDAVFSDIASEITSSYPRDGRAPLTGPLDLGNNNVINAKAAVIGTEVPIASQVMLRDGSNSATADMNFGGKKIYNVAPGVASGEVATMDNIASIALGTAIAGEIKMYAGRCGPAAADAPAGYFFMNGEAVNRTTYGALFAIIGTTFGAGDGVNTYNLPDWRNRSPIGVGYNYLTGVPYDAEYTKTSVEDLGKYVPGRSYGAVRHVHGVPNHTHDLTHTHTINHSHTAGTLRAQIGGTAAEQDKGLWVMPDGVNTWNAAGGYAFGSLANPHNITKSGNTYSCETWASGVLQGINTIRFSLGGNPWGYSDFSGMADPIPGPTRTAFSTIVQGSTATHSGSSGASTRASTADGATTTIDATHSVGTCNFIIKY